MNLTAYRHLSIPCPVMRDGLRFIMPNKDGVEACREIMEFAPNTRVIMLTASTEDDVVTQVVARIRAGAEQGREKGVAGLTERDLEVLASFAQGTSYARIAEARGVKPVTIRNADLNDRGHAHAAPIAVLCAIGP